MAKKRVLGVVGMGHVGAHVAYALAIQGIADELVLVDQNEQKLASEVQDLRDAVAYMPHRVTVRGGDFSDLGVCDVIVNSVGKIDLLRGTHDRVTEMDFTIPAVRGYAEKIKASGFDGVLINITNPCDIVTRELALHLGLPRGRVFGTGTGLDTSRLLSALARQTGLDHKSITCYMMGEHGNQQFAPWSCVSFRGVPLDEWAKTDERFRFDRDALQKESIGGGWVTYMGKQCTEYGIATTAARMAHIVLHDEKAIMPASMELCGEYGESGLFAGVPCVIGANGVEQVVELPLTDEEKADLKETLEKYKTKIESGAMTVNDAATDYALKVQQDSTYQTGIKDENGMQSSYMPDAFISAIKEMKEGDVEVVESTKYMIVLHRLPVKDDEDTLLESSDNRSQLLLELKNTEYADAVSAAAQSFEGVEWNQKVLNRYKPSMFADTKKNGTSSVASESSDESASSEESSAESSETSSETSETSSESSAQ